MKRATETFAWSGGLLHWGTELPDSDPAVLQFPGFFEPVETETPKRRGRPAGSKNKPKNADADG